MQKVARFARYEGVRFRQRVLEGECHSRGVIAAIRRASSRAKNLSNT